MTAQGVRVSGTVLRVAGADSTPLSSHWVTLHRLASTGSGPVDSTRTDRAGHYAFSWTEADTAARYVMGVSYAGVAYLTTPVGIGRRAVAVEPVLVFDSTSTQPVILSQRHTLVQPSNPDGSFPVLELLVLRNAGSRTRVAPDRGHPAWTGRVLPGALEVEVGESDVSADQVLRWGDTVAVAAPIPPGEKQIVLTYLLPGSTRDLVFPADQPTGEVDVMVADTTAVLARGPLRVVGVTSFENHRYLRFEGRDLAVGRGGGGLIRLAPRPLAPGDLWWTVVVLSALGLAAGFVRWWRADRAQGGLTDAEWIAAQIAALDAAPTDGDPAARQQRRAELMSRLAATLARQTRDP